MECERGATKRGATRDLGEMGLSYTLAVPVVT